ncbi:hypothetical protein GCM10027414_07050 [Humibacter ginsengiterrae]
MALTWITVAALAVGLVLLLWGMYLASMTIFPSYVSTGVLMTSLGAGIAGSGTLGLFFTLTAAAIVHAIRQR